jgi:hypothetical protein
MYIVFLRKGAGTINLETVKGDFKIHWFDPKNGGRLQNGQSRLIQGGSIREIKGAPSEPEKDWVVLLQKK